MSCGRDDLPERLHTHLSTNNQSEDLSNTSNGENVPKDDRLTPTDEGKTFENRTLCDGTLLEDLKAAIIIF